MKASTLNTWFITLLRAVEARGVDSRALVLRAGLDPDQINDPNLRSPVEKTSRLWRMAVEATGDPCLGLKVATYVQPATFHTLGMALLASRNLEDVMHRSARFSGIVSDAMSFQIQSEGAGTKQVVSWVAEVPVVDESIDLMMASTVKMGMLMLGIDARTPRPISLRLRRSTTPEMCEEFQAYFRCPIQFGAEENSLWVPDEWMQRPLPMANPTLARQSDLVVMAYLSRFGRDSLAERVRAEMISRLPAGEPSRSAVASALSLSEKTLQRRLHDEGTTYLDVLDEVRRDLAQSYLRDSAITLFEITFRLGFSDQSAFTRALRRWTGLAPGEFRQQTLSRPA